MHLSRKAVFCIPMRPPQAKCAVQCKKPAVERAFFWECGRWLLRDHRFTAERLCGCHRCFFRRSARRAGVRYSIACADNHGIIAEAEFAAGAMGLCRSEEHTSELQSPCNLVCRLLLEKKKNTTA